MSKTDKPDEDADTGSWTSAATLAGAAIGSAAIAAALLYASNRRDRADKARARAKAAAFHAEPPESD